MTVHSLNLGMLACVAITAVVPATAGAQILAPRESAQIQFGPMALYPSVQIVDAGIDENVFNDPDDPKDDFTLTVASRLLTVVRVGLNELMFSTGSDYVWFREYASERSSNQSYAARFNLSASRFKPYIGGEHLRTRARPSPEIDARARRVTNMATAGSNFTVTERTDLTGSVQWDSSAFEDGEQFRGVDLDDRLNRTGRMYKAGVRYDVTPFTALLVSGVVREDIFPLSHLRDSKSYGVIPTVEFAPEAAIRGSLSAGYQVFVPENPELVENRGVVFDGTLNWAVASTTMFDLSLGRRVSYSFEDIDPYYLQTGARLTITQRVGGPFSVVGTADRQHLSYRWGQSGSAIGGETRSDTVDVLSGGVTVRLGHGVSVLIGAETTRRQSSDNARQNFNRTRLLSTISLGSS
jgi:hypothetical protein